jgi:hypothetical protein
MLAKVTKWHVLVTIAQFATTITSFELQMLKTKLNTFALVRNFINENFEPYHFIVGLFEAPNTLWSNKG